MSIRKLLCLSCVFLALGFLTACGDDDDVDITIIEDEPTPSDPTPSENAHVSIDYSASFTKDLLDFVTPVISYTDMNGTHETVIPDSDCTYQEPEFTVGGEVVKGTPYYCWKKKIILKDIPVENTVTVKYVRKNSAVFDDSKSYRFAHYLSVGSVFAAKGNAMLLNTYTEITIGGKTETYAGQNAEDYIDALCQMQDKLKISIDDNLVVTKE